MSMKSETLELFRRIKAPLLVVEALLPTLHAVAVPSASELNDRVNEVVNGVTIFPSQDTASSGVFSFDSKDPSVTDTDIDLLKIPVTHTFGEEENVLHPQIRGVLGNLKSTRSIETGGPGSVAPRGL